MDEEKTSTALIAVTRLPEIKENLRSLRERWEQKAQDAAGLVCTDESVQSVKTMRAEMRKEFDEADRQRKEAKDRYMAAWNDVESVWKECVADPFKKADSAFKSEIDAFENQLKEELREKLNAYYDELCAAEKIDFVPFDRALLKSGIKIGLADAKAKTPRKLQDALSGFVSQIALDVERISSMDDAAEIMAFYRVSLDFGEAISRAQQLKQSIQREKEAAERRKAEMERQAEAVKKVEAAATVAAPVPVAASAPVQDEKVYPVFKFTVYNCTRTQLIKVRDYLKQEGIQYE